MLAPRPSDLDAAIRSTDNDAAQARLSAVRKGYLQDPFINYFVKQARFIPPRPPLINIGTYLRSEAIDALVNRWLQLDLPGGEKQIVSLGAGSDTRFWRINVGFTSDRNLMCVFKYGSLPSSKMNLKGSCLSILRLIFQR